MPDYTGPHIGPGPRLTPTNDPRRAAVEQQGLAEPGSIIDTLYRFPRSLAERYAEVPKNILSAGGDAGSAALSALKGLGQAPSAYDPTGQAAPQSTQEWMDTQRSVSRQPEASIAPPKAPSAPNLSSFMPDASIDKYSVPQTEADRAYASTPIRGSDETGQVSGAGIPGNTGTGWSVPGGGKLTGVLEGLRSSGGMDPSTNLYMLQNKLKDEYERNLSKGSLDTGPYRYSTGTVPKDLLQASRDVAESLPEQYKQQQLDEAQRQYEARMGGFGGPQQQAQYSRAQEAAKIGAPVDVAKIQAGSAENVQRLKDAGYEDFFNKLAMMGVQAPGTTIQGPGGVRYSTAPVSPGAATTGEKSLEQLQAELNRYQNPKWDDIVLKMTPETDRLQHISDIQGRIAAIQGRVGGRPQGQSQSMRYVAPGTRDRINGVPVVWDGHGWAAEGQ